MEPGDRTTAEGVDTPVPAVDPSPDGAGRRIPRAHGLHRWIGWLALPLAAGVVRLVGGDDLGVGRHGGDVDGAAEVAQR